jgi:hypothetical protein
MALAGAVAVMAASSLATARDAIAEPLLKVAVRVRPLPRADGNGDLAGTGNVAGAGAEVSVGLTITGTEYSGYPSPLTTLTLLLPPGMHWSSSGFPICSFRAGDVVPLAFAATPNTLFPSSCPAQTEAGLGGTGTGAVDIGTAYVPEPLQSWVFSAPGGGLDLELEGHPFRFSTFSNGPGPLAGSRQGLQLRVPPTETFPAGRDMSLTSLTLHLGATRTVSHGRRFSLRMPRVCRRGSLPFTVETSSLGGANLAPAHVRTTFRAPCPRGARRTN